MKLCDCCGKVRKDTRGVILKLKKAAWVEVLCTDCRKWSRESGMMSGK